VPWQQQHAMQLQQTQQQKQQQQQEEELQEVPPSPSSVRARVRRRSAMLALPPLQGAAGGPFDSGAYSPLTSTPTGSAGWSSQGRCSSIATDSPLSVSPAAYTPLARQGSQNQSRHVSR
jgi:hypothetical protein